jgi:hypothetical protein
MADFSPSDDGYEEEDFSVDFSSSYYDLYGEYDVENKAVNISTNQSAFSRRPTVTVVKRQVESLPAPDRQLENKYYENVGPKRVVRGLTRPVGERFRKFSQNRQRQTEAESKGEKRQEQHVWARKDWMPEKDKWPLGKEEEAVKDKWVKNGAANKNKQSKNGSERNGTTASDKARFKHERQRSVHEWTWFPGQDDSEYGSKALGRKQSETKKKNSGEMAEDRTLVVKGNNNKQNCSANAENLKKDSFDIRRGVKKTRVLDAKQLERENTEDSSSNSYSKLGENETKETRVFEGRNSGPAEFPKQRGANGARSVNGGKTASLGVKKGTISQEKNETNDEVTVSVLGYPGHLFDPHEKEVENHDTRDLREAGDRKIGDKREEPVRPLFVNQPSPEKVSSRKKGGDRKPKVIETKPLVEVVQKRSLWQAAEGGAKGLYRVCEKYPSRVFRILMILLHLVLLAVFFVFNGFQLAVP